jgi:hypothetical protein
MEKKQKICEYCGTEFPAKSLRAKYCCNSCRTKAYRVRNGIPFPDFANMITSKNPTSIERKMHQISDEINIISIEEINLDNLYKSFLKKYKEALKMKGISNDSWSKENLKRREKEFNEIRYKQEALIREKELLTKRLQEYDLERSKNSLKNMGLIISADEIIESVLDPLDFHGFWQRAIGKPDSNFKCYFYGTDDMKNMELSLRFAGYLKQFGETLFMTNKNIDSTIKKILLKYEIRKIDICHSEKIAKTEFIISKGNYDFIVIHSKNIQLSKTNFMDKLIDKYPKKSFSVFEINPNFMRKYVLKFEYFVNVDNLVVPRKKTY